MSKINKSIIKVSKFSIFVGILWVILLFDIVYRWDIISNKTFFIVDIIVYILAFIGMGVGILWLILFKKFKSISFLLLLISLSAAIFIICSGKVDTIKVYLDFVSHYKERTVIAEKLSREYRAEMKTEPHPKSSVYLGKEYENLSTQGHAQIHNDRGCIEVDFEVFDGSRANMPGSFLYYGKSGHITFVTDINNYNLKGGTIQDDILCTEKIFGNWYYVETKY